MATKILKGLLLLGVAGAINMACEDQAVSVNEDDPILSVAELSSQLASGTEISFTTQSSSSAKFGGGPPSGGGKPGTGSRRKSQDPLLMVMSLAERMGQHQSGRMLTRMGATIKHYDANGNEIVLEIPQTPEEQKQFGKFHEAMAGVVKSVIELSGTSPWGTSSSGKMTIDRVVSDDSVSETITFESFSINGISVEGVRHVSRTMNQESGEMHLTSTVSNGAITLEDGTVLQWVSDKKRDGQFIIGADGSLNSGYFLTESSTTLIESDGTVRYSYRTTEPVKVDLTCSGRKPKPVSGSITTEYNDNDIEVKFGNGSCDNRSVTVTINGVTKARNING